MMPTRLPMLIVCVVVVSFLMSACVSKSKYTTLESDLNQTRTNLQTTASDKQGAEQARDRCRAEYATLQASYDERGKENTELAEELKKRSTKLKEVEKHGGKTEFRLGLAAKN